MPIEIRELVIKAVISESKKDNSNGLRPEDLAKMKKEMIKEVTEKVMKSIKQKNER